MKRATFVSLLLAIVSVSAYDSLRCVADARELYAVEMNPLARFLIDGEDVSRTHPGACSAVEVTEKQLATGWDCFKALLRYWQCKNNYRPDWSAR